MQRRLLAVLSISSSLILGCGHTEAQWKAELTRYDKLQSHCTVDTEQLHGELATARVRESELTQKLRDAGVDLEARSTEVTQLSSTLQERERALAESRSRAQKLEHIKHRFDALHRKLDSLVSVGLVVNIRHNKMVISLPGDVLFDSGRDILRPDGQEILRKVASVIRDDRALSERDYQVAGHTDDQPVKNSAFKDNWGLSLMRSRAVLTFLLGREGKLPRRHWSAAGFADTDPIVVNASRTGQQKNRRCEIILMPDVDEMLDLQALTR